MSVKYKSAFGNVILATKPQRDRKNPSAEPVKSSFSLTRILFWRYSPLGEKSLCQIPCAFIVTQGLWNTVPISQAAGN